jgi:triosephosphate isomerase
MMAARRPLIAGNWKMFHGGRSGAALAAQMPRLAEAASRVDVVICPPFTALAACARACEGSAVAIGGQNLHPKSEGAFTGEISAPMLLDAGCTYVIIGHSERRQHFGETDANVAHKVDAALAAGLVPIVCVGETLEEREGGKCVDVVMRQIRAFLPVLAQSNVTSAIAYEPVWAIGTGKNAGPAEAEEVHEAIRKSLLGHQDALAARTRILYGGSVKPENAASLLACPNVDGALVGGASLDASSFGAIARAAQSLAAAT